MSYSDTVSIYLSISFSHGAYTVSTMSNRFGNTLYVAVSSVNVVCYLYHQLLIDCTSNSLLIYIKFMSRSVTVSIFCHETYTVSTMCNHFGNAT